MNPLQSMSVERIVLWGRVQNRENGASDLTVVRLHDSENRTISNLDVREGPVETDPLKALASSASEHFVGFDGYAQAGAYRTRLRPAGSESDRTTTVPRPCVSSWAMRSAMPLQSPAPSASL